MNLIHYLLEANLYLAAFWLLYVLLLRSETLYQLNRVYLLLTSVLAFVIPLLQFGVLKPAAEPLISIDNIMPMQTQNTVKVVHVTPAPVNHFAITDYGLMLYATVTFTLLLVLIFKIVKLMAMAKKGVAVQKDGFVLVELPSENAAFSFFGYLFINQQLASSATILCHEEVHIRQRHSWDIVYLELLKIMNWFNPVVYLLQKSIREVHEFIADEHASAMENGASEYADFLISNAYGLPQTMLTNSFFNKNLLKRRITMLYQKKSGKAARLKYLLAVPLFGGMVCASTLAFTKDYGWIDIAPKTIALKHADTTAHNPNAPAANDTSAYAKGWRDAERDMVLARLQSKINSLAPPKRDASDDKPISAKAMADSVFKAVDETPMFPGGMGEFKMFLARNIKYPKEAKDAKISGHVFLSFIVEKDGAISNVNIVRDPGSGLGAEAQRVLQISPKWQPGKVKGKNVRTAFTIPVNFSLDASQDVSSPVIPQINNNEPLVNGQPVYNAVEVNPEFPGGDAAFNDYLRKNVRYPKEARENGVQGRVFVQFTVEQDGSLTDMKVLRDPGTGLGAEAMRVLSASPKWNPGRQKGEPVRVQYTVPVNFALVDDIVIRGTALELNKFMATHVRYSTDARARNIQGRVFATFTVGDNQKVENIEILRSPDKLLSDEVVRVLSTYRLTDGERNVSYVLPVNFLINTGNDTYETKAPENAQPIANKAKVSYPRRVSLYEVVVVTYKPTENK